MVDKYKKILAGKDPHAEQFMEEQNFLGNVDGEAIGTISVAGTNEQDASTGNAGTTGAEDKAGTPEQPIQRIPPNPHPPKPVNIPKSLPAL